MKFLLLLTAIFTSTHTAIADHGCYSIFGEFKDTLSKTIDDIGVIRKTPANQSAFKVDEYYIEASDMNLLAKDPKYKEFLDETVEIFYKDIEPFGHITLRVGDRIYAFNHVQFTTQKNFSPARISKGQKGYVFQSNKKVIEKTREKINAFYDDSRKYNVPPFDAYGPQLEVVKSSNGSLKYKSPSPQHRNNSSISSEVKLLDEGEDAFLVTPAGFKYKLSKKNGKYYTPSYSCSSATTCVMNKFLGMEIEADLGKGGAKYLKAYLEKNTEMGFNDLKAIINY